MEGLRSLMDAIDGPRVVAMETSVASALSVMRDLQPSVLIVDKHFGAALLADWMRLLSTAEKPTGVIVWGALMGQVEALRFLQAGAAGVIRKTASLPDLVACVRAVASGGHWMETDPVRDLRPALASPVSTLTPRELQVMHLVERGYKNKDIAEALEIRTGTVKIHLKHIFEKTGIRGRYVLAISGLQQRGLISAIA